ncbi:MAG: hypothetical protein R2823_09535 [Acidimicrobiia bacterium]
MNHHDAPTWIDDRLDRAATDTKRSVATMELRSITTRQGRQRSEKLVAAGGAFALMVGAAGVAAILVAQEPARQPLMFGSDSAPPAPVEQGSDDAGNTVTTIAPDPAPDSGAMVESMPQLGLVLDGWGSVTAGEGSHAREVYYTHGGDGGGEGDRTTVGIETNIFATPEELEAASAESDTHWAQLIDSGTATQLDDVVVGTGDSAHAYLLKEGTGPGFPSSFPTVWFTWQSSSRSFTNLIVSYGSVDDAVLIAQSIQELSDEDWNAILTEAAALGAGDESPVSTTTSMAP